MSQIRVLVVDDSVVVRRLVTDALSQDPQVEVVGVAANGKLAQAKAESLNPDLITMDVEMPEMNGIEAVRALRKSGKTMPIIMFSTLTERGASATLDALAAGASDYVAKPSNVGSVQESIAQVRESLIPKIKALVQRPATRRLPITGAGAGGPAAAQRPRVEQPVQMRQEPPAHPIRAVVLGCSTGGPEALAKVITALTTPLPVPMLVVQHMPAVFTRQLAARMDRIGPSTVVEAVEGQPVLPGTIYIAPGDKHMQLRRVGVSLRTAIVDGPPVNFCRPAVDVLFHSAAQLMGRELLAVILTGMGQDGKVGCGEIGDAGGTVIVQDEQSSVVWGMPGAVATAGFAHRVLPITDIARTIEQIVSRASSGPSARSLSEVVR